MRKRQRHTSPAQIREKSAAAHARIDAPLPSAQPDAAIPFSIQLVFMYRQRPAPVRRIAFRRMTQRRPRTNLATTNRHCMRRAAAASHSSRRVVLTPAPDRMHRRQRRPLSASSRRCASIDRYVRSMRAWTRSVACVVPGRCTTGVHATSTSSALWTSRGSRGARTFLGLRFHSVRYWWRLRLW
jgi:hypothetical protein